MVMIIYGHVKLYKTKLIKVIIKNPKIDDGFCNKL